MHLFLIMLVLIVAVHGQDCRIYYKDLPHPLVLENSITSISFVTQKLSRYLSLEVAIRPIALEEETTPGFQALEVSFADLDSLIALISPERVLKEAVILSPVDEKLYYLNAVQLNNSIEARIRRNNRFWWLGILLMVFFGIWILYLGVQWVSVKYFDADLISHLSNGDWSSGGFSSKSSDLLPSGSIGNRGSPMEKKVFWEAFGVWACIAIVFCFI